MHKMRSMGFARRLFLAAVVATLAQQVLASLTEDEKATLKKIEKRYKSLMSTDISTIFGVLRTCTVDPNVEIAECIAAALQQTGSVKQSNKANRVPHYLKQIDYTCVKVALTYRKYRSLLSDPSKIRYFSTPVGGLLRDQEVCATLDRKHYTASEVLRALS